MVGLLTGPRVTVEVALDNQGRAQDVIATVREHCVVVVDIADRRYEWDSPTLAPGVHTIRIPPGQRLEWPASAWSIGEAQV